MLTALGRIVRSPWVRYGFLTLAVVLAGWAVWRDRSGVADAFGRLGPAAATVAVLMTVLHVVAAGSGWRSVLADLGSPLPVGAAGRMFLVGQIARYVPGSIWQVVALAEAGTRHDIPRRRTASASIVALLVSIAAGAGCVVVLLGPLGVLGLPAWVVVTAPLPLLALHPRVLNPLLATVMRIARRPPLGVRLSGPGILRASGWALLAWAFLGAQVYVLAVGLGAPSGLRTAATCTAGFVVAWVAGLLVVVAPAGVGVREVVLAALLSDLLEPGAVILLVLTSRVLLTGVEIAVAAPVLAAGLRSSPAGPDERTDERTDQR